MNSPKGTGPFISQMSQALGTSASLMLEQSCPQTALLLHHHLYGSKAQKKANPSKSDSVTCHHTAELCEDTARVRAAQAARLSSFVHINVLGNHTEELLNLMAQTITKQYYMSIFKMMGL